jgi:spore coat polysaccharide biosynthesis protein SpsF
VTFRHVPIVLQARIGSRRLPAKALAPIAGRPLLEHCLRRLLAAGAGRVVLATTLRAEDDVLAEMADRLQVEVFRGPEDDVLQRFVMVADYVGAPVFIRATGDNPAVDMDAPARVIDALAATGADHVVEAGLPLGTAVEAVRTSALYEAAALASDRYDREHVTPFLYRNPARFRAVSVPAPAWLRRPDLRFTVDTPGDLVFVRAAIEAAAGTPCLAPLRDVIAAADHLAAREEATT